MNVSQLKTKGSATDADIAIGQRVRLRRSILGVSQSQLAEFLDITFQQVQKYEKGLNRISASRLYEIGKILGVPLDYFYEDFDLKVESVLSEEVVNLSKYVDDAEAVRLLKAYYNIKDENLRKSVVRFIKELSN